MLINQLLKDFFGDLVSENFMFAHCQKFDPWLEQVQERQEFLDFIIKFCKAIHENLDYVQGKSLSLDVIKEDGVNHAVHHFFIECSFKSVFFHINDHAENDLPD